MHCTYLDESSLSSKEPRFKGSVMFPPSKNFEGKTLGLFLLLVA